MNFPPRFFLIGACMQLELRDYDTPDSVILGDGNVDLSDATSCEEKKESTTYDATDQSNRSNKGIERHTMGNDSTANTISEMRGVYCKSTIPPNAVCMAIPRKCL